MSDFFAPSYWYGAGPSFSGLSNAQQQYNQNQNYFNNVNNTLSQAHVPQSQLYGGGSFGAQPAYYAGVGASYGRATGGFGGLGAPNADPFTPVGGGGGGGSTPSPFRGVEVAPSPFDTPNAGGVPYLDNPFTPATSPFSGGASPFRGYDSGPSAPFQSAFPSGGVGSASPPSSYQNPWNNPSMVPPMIGGVGRGATPQASAPQTDWTGGNAAVPWMMGGGQAFPGGGVGSANATNPRDRLAQIMSGSEGNQGAANIGQGFTQAGGGAAEPPAFGGGSPFRDFGRAFQSAFPTGTNAGGIGSGGSAGVAPGYGGFTPGPSPGVPSAGRGFMGGGGVMAQGGDDDGATFAERWGQMQAPAKSGPDMSNFQSPANSYSTFQRGATNPWTQKVPNNDPNIMNSIYRAAGQMGNEPSALAGVIGVESNWNPAAKTGQYRGLTQMGPKSFAEAGGTLNGMTFDQYKSAPGEKQIDTYVPWLQSYARNNPNNAASLVAGGLGNVPAPTQAAIMQGTQFAPNSTRWPSALAEGNPYMPTTASKQAAELGNKSINAMTNSYMARGLR